MNISKSKFKVKDPISALTHFIGFLAVIPIFIMLMLRAKAEASELHMIGFAVFEIGRAHV